MGVAGGNPLHNRAVCDAQIADAVDPQLGVDSCSSPNGHRVRPVAHSRTPFIGSREPVLLAQAHATAVSA